MQITLLQRVQLISLIPPKGNYEKMVVAKDLRKKVGLTQEEIMENKVRTGEDNMIRMDKNPEKEMEFTELEKEMFKESLKILNEKGELDENLLPLYSLFVL